MFQFQYLGRIMLYIQGLAASPSSGTATADYHIFMASSSTTTTCVAIEATESTVIGELTRGRDTADRLRRALRQTTAPPAHVQGLVAEILDSFTHSISMLVQVPPLLINSRKSEGSGDSCKTPKDRRGCHKRRRSCETWTKETPAWPEDGYAWRKYGQKDILNTKHPRSYFRCTHKHDQGCQATKQVQKIQDDPPLFKATYHSHHSCNNYSSNHRHLMIMEDNTPPESSIIWSFQDGNGIKQESPSTSPTAAQASQSESGNNVCGRDCLASELAAALSSCSDPDRDEIYSCSATTTHSHSLELAYYNDNNDDGSCWFELQ